jgi:hypothetical protein
MGTQLTAEDVGKRVVYDGETIGRIVEYDDATAYMEPDPDITDVVRSKFEWGDKSETAFPLQRELIADIGETEVRLVAEL